MIQRVVVGLIAGRSGEKVSAKSSPINNSPMPASEAMAAPDIAQSTGSPAPECVLTALFELLQDQGEEDDDDHQQCHDDPGARPRARPAAAGPGHLRKCGSKK